MGNYLITLDAVLVMFLGAGGHKVFKSRESEQADWPVVTGGIGGTHPSVSY